ncbi:hypothetical protein DFH07DRAFT_769596 [Mycena maculata]|uniref:Uncharacterized protein n=1 Tax=Mycena maculata TaxID=230809 RepID=A0AAD7NM49_9AGAR|nr:hypothetical protein DFH07DRAFT_769596 [Mycena maculata]
MIVEIIIQQCFYNRTDRLQRAVKMIQVELPPTYVEPISCCGTQENSGLNSQLVLALQPAVVQDVQDPGISVKEELRVANSGPPDYRNLNERRRNNRNDNIAFLASEKTTRPSRPERQPPSLERCKTEAEIWTASSRLDAQCRKPQPECAQSGEDETQDENRELSISAALEDPVHDGHEEHGSSAWSYVRGRLTVEIPTERSGIAGPKGRESANLGVRTEPHWGGSTSILTRDERKKWNAEPTRDNTRMRCGVPRCQMQALGRTNGRTFTQPHRRKGSFETEERGRRLLCSSKWDQDAWERNSVAPQIAMARSGTEDPIRHSNDAWRTASGYQLTARRRRRKAEDRGVFMRDSTRLGLRTLYYFSEPHEVETILIIDFKQIKNKSRRIRWVRKQSPNSWQTEALRPSTGKTRNKDLSRRGTAEGQGDAEGALCSKGSIRDERTVKSRTEPEGSTGSTFTGLVREQRHEELDGLRSEKTEPPLAAQRLRHGVRATRKPRSDRRIELRMVSSICLKSCQLEGSGSEHFPKGRRGYTGSAQRELDHMASEVLEESEEVERPDESIVHGHAYSRLYLVDLHGEPHDRVEEEVERSRMFAIVRRPSYPSGYSADEGFSRVSDLDSRRYTFKQVARGSLRTEPEALRLNVHLATGAFVIRTEVIQDADKTWRTLHSKEEPIVNQITMFFRVLRSGALISQPPSAGGSSVKNPRGGKGEESPLEAIQQLMHRLEWMSNARVEYIEDGGAGALNVGVGQNPGLEERANAAVGGAHQKAGTRSLRGRSRQWTIRDGLLDGDIDRRLTMTRGPVLVDELRPPGTDELSLDPECTKPAEMEIRAAFGELYILAQVQNWSVVLNPSGSPARAKTSSLPQSGHGPSHLQLLLGTNRQEGSVQGTRNVRETHAASSAASRSQRNDGLFKTLRYGRRGDVFQVPSTRGPACSAFEGVIAGTRHGRFAVETEPNRVGGSTSSEWPERVQVPRFQKVGPAVETERRRNAETELPQAAQCQRLGQSRRSWDACRRRLESGMTSPEALNVEMEPLPAARRLRRARSRNQLEKPYHRAEKRRVRKQESLHSISNVLLNTGSSQSRSQIVVVIATSTSTARAVPLESEEEGAYGARSSSARRGIQAAHGTNSDVRLARCSINAWKSSEPNLSSANSESDGMASLRANIWPDFRDVRRRCSPGGDSSNEIQQGCAAQGSEIDGEVKSVVATSKQRESASGASGAIVGSSSAL